MLRRTLRKPEKKNKNLEKRRKSGKIKTWKKRNTNVPRTQTYPVKPNIPSQAKTYPIKPNIPSQAKHTQSSQTYP